MVKLHGYRFIFGISILSLALLVAWWSVFLTQSIGRQRTLLRENLTARLDYFALQLTTSGSEFPGTGMLPQDERFEIVPGGRESRPFVKLLKSSRPPLYLRVREAALEQIEDEFKRKRFMLIGESSLLVLLLLFCSILLYKFIRLEKRSTEEIEEFWGRMTHEIKTPITGIKAFLQSLKNRSLDESQVSTLVDMALQEVEKQEQLAENILAGSSLKRKDVALKLVDLNIGKFLENYFAGHILYLSGVKVRLDIDKKKGLLATADPHALKITLSTEYDLKGTELHGSLGYRFSTADGQNKSNANINGHFGKFGFALSGNFRNAGDYYAPAGAFGEIELAKNVAVNDTGVKDGGMNLLVNYNFSTQSQLTFKYEYYHAEDAGFGPRVPVVDNTPLLPYATYRSIGAFIQDDMSLFKRTSLILGLRYQNVNARTKETSLTANFTHIKSKDLANPEIPYVDTFSSKFNVNARYEYPDRHFWLGYNLRINGNQQDVQLGDNPIGEIIPGFTVHSLSGGITLFKDRLFPMRLGLIVGNLTNALYSEFSNASFFRPAPKRHVVLTWSMAF
jgi:hypothetical protein